MSGGLILIKLHPCVDLLYAWFGYSHTSPTYRVFKRILILLKVSSIGTEIWSLKHIETSHYNLFSDQTRDY